MRGVATDANIEAVNAPLQVVVQAGGKTLFKGTTANVVLNSRGLLITAYAKERRGQRWRVGRQLR